MQTVAMATTMGGVTETAAGRVSLGSRARVGRWAVRSAYRRLSLVSAQGQTTQQVNQRLSPRPRRAVSRMTYRRRPHPKERDGEDGRLRLRRESSAVIFPPSRVIHIW